MRRLWLSAVLFGVAPAQAQAPATGQPDNAAILRAIEGLSGQIKTLNGRIDRLEEKDRKREPAAPAAAVPKAVAPPPKAVPGWFVRLIPWTIDGGGDPVAGFAGPMFEFNFDMHSRHVPDNNRYFYNGVSYLHIKEDGVYVFNMTLEPVMATDPQTGYSTLWFNCTGEFFVSGNRLITGTTTFGQQQRPERDVFRSQTFYGQLRLTPGSYKVEFKTDCAADQDKKLTVFDKWLPVWKKNRFKIMIKTPADTMARPFTSADLYYVGQP